jgi:hypothetical protein
MLVRYLDPRMRDAIILSTWWSDAFNVPERIALALAIRRATLPLTRNGIAECPKDLSPLCKKLFPQPQVMTDRPCDVEE